MAFIKDLNQDEIRDGWLVKSDMKKVWNRQLEIWQEVDRICRKHKIPYWAAYGTLLGAARHKGFIPWDKDMDFCMMRPDFDCFRKALDEELKDSLFEIKNDNFSFLQVSHAQTTLITTGFLDVDMRLPSIAVDIFPLDIDLDDTKDGFLAFTALNELLFTIFNFPVIDKHIKEGGSIVNDWSVIEKLHSISDMREQCKVFTLYAEALFNQSSQINWLLDSTKRLQNSFQKEWFRRTIYLPFETVELPVPISYEAVLTRCYGDWHKFVHDGIERLGIIYSADIPYREFLQRINFELISPEKTIGN